MICPCCSVGEVSPQTDVCELCGYSVEANVTTATGKPASRSASKADPTKTTVKISAQGTAGTATAIAVSLKDSKGKRIKTGGDRVVVAVTGANRERPEVADVGNGTYTATYTPIVAGTDRLAITLNGVPVGGSPFVTEVAAGPADPSQTTAAVPTGTAGKITAVVVTVRDANGNAVKGGDEKVEVDISGPNQDAKPTVTVNGDETYTVNYTPKQAGADEIVIRVNGTGISGSPFESAVQPGEADPAHVTVRVPEGCTPGQASTLMVTARDAFGNRLPRGGHDVSVSVAGANATHVKVMDVGNGTYTATYTPVLAGEDVITVELGGVAVEGSPFSVTVTEGAADAIRSTATIPVGAAGQPTSLVVHARDGRGNRLKSGGDHVEVTVSGANASTPDVADVGDGTYRATYVPTVAGTDQVAVTVNGTPINGSPFESTVEPGDIAPSQAIFVGKPGARAGRPYTFTVATRDAHGNALTEGGDTVTCHVAGKEDRDLFDVVDNGDGTYACTFTPETGDTVQVIARVNGEEIAGGPWAVTVAAGGPSAKQTIAEVTGGTAGSPTTIVVRTRDQFGNDCTEARHRVDVMVVGANEDAEAYVVDNDDGTYSASYTPKSAGTDYITVSLDGVVIGDSPVASEVTAGPADANESIAMLPSSCRAGSRTNLFVTARDAFGNQCSVGGDAVVVTLTGTNESVDVETVDNKNGTYLAHFTPHATGDGEIIVTLNGTQIAESPFEFHVVAGVVDPLQAVAIGGEAGSVGVPYDLTVKTRDQFGNDAIEGGHAVDVMVTGANDGVRVKVRDNHDGTYHATYTPQRPGSDRMAVTVNGRHIGGEPLRPTIGVGGASIHSTARVLSGKAGKVSTITVTARDAAGNEIRAGGDSVVVDVSVANSARPPVTDHGDGTYTASYTPTSTGTDYVAVTINGLPLVGSPFQSRISSGPTDATQSVATVPATGRAGHALNIGLSMRDVHGNEVTHGGQIVQIAVSGANDGQSLMLTDNRDGTYSATYTPTVAGRDHVSISVNGKPVGGGTFTTVIKPDSPHVAQTTALFPPGTVGSLTTITVTLRDAYRNRVAGDGLLQVELEGANRGTPLQTMDNRDGTYTVTYIPTIAGTDYLRVYLGDQEVRESPFAGTVSAGRAASERTVALVPDGVAGVETRIALTARDSYGNPMATTDGVEVVVRGVNEDAPIRVEDLGGGEYAATYRPTVAGVDRVFISVNGTAVRGGPFTSAVEAGALDPIHCTATVPAGTVGTPSTISVMARDIYDNDVTLGGAAVDVQIAGPNVGTPIQMTDRGNGTYSAVYTPMTAGTDELTISVNGVLIGGNPFTSRVIASRVEAAVTVPTATAPKAAGVPRRVLQPTMACPRCSAADISPETHQCELCGLVLLNALVPRGSHDPATAELETADEQIADVKERVAAELGAQFHLESILRQTPDTVTYLAKNRIDAQRGVLKVVRRETVTDSDIAAFERNVDRARQLRHSHLIPVHAHGVTDGAVWSWSDYVSGQQFGDIMRAAGRMDVEACVNWIEQIAGALDYMHRRGVVHGNLKPSNVLVDAQRWARLADQLLIPLDPDSIEGESLEYLAPEQLAREPVSAATDQYSLALLTYVCLAGKSPFAGQSIHQAMAGRTSVVPLADVRSDVPARMSAAVSRALSLVPADRFPRITDFVQALGPGEVSIVPVAEGRPSGAAAAALPRVFVIHGPPRQFPVGSIAAGAAVVLLAAGAMAFLQRSDAPGWALVDPGNRPRPATVSAAPGTPLDGLDSMSLDSMRLDSMPREGQDAIQTPTGQLPSPQTAGDTAAAPVVAAQPNPQLPVDTAPPTPVRPQPTPPVLPRPPARDSVVTPPADTTPPRVEPVSRFGMLTITSTPAARLYIDERPMGTTPGEELPLDPGLHIIRITLFGYLPWEREIRIQAGERIVLPNVVLQPR